MVYFSSAPVAPEMLDLKQYAALTEFRKWCESKGLIEQYSNYVEFREKITRQLQIQLQKSPYLIDLIRGQSVPTIADDNPVEQVVRMSPEAMELLQHAASGDGTILKLATLGGRYIQSNGKTFGDPRDRRSQARWEYALEELLTFGLLVGRGHKGEVFQVSAPGYEMADQLEGKS